MAALWLNFLCDFLILTLTQWLKNNPDKIRLDRVSETAYVRRERVVDRITRPQVDVNSFDGSQHRGSQPSDSASHVYVLKR